jgi:hypothetical protein
VVRVQYQMAGPWNHGVFTVTVTSTFWQLDCRDALADSLFKADLKPKVEAGRKHGELHASRNASPYRSTSHSPDQCWS